jgi:triosephosphate isomerase
MRTTLIAGNWKMNGSLASVIELVEGIKVGLAAGQFDNAELVVCPSSIFLREVSSMLGGTGVLMGAQNVCDQAVGAFTGEISATMLKECGCRYALVGHSERRALYLESDQQVADRFAMAVKSGLIPILCVGESLKEREEGLTEAVVMRQLESIIDSQSILAIANSVIAYEPVWAIGTGEVATPDQAQAVHRFIRNKLAALDSVVADKVQILYGGSMNPKNAKDLLSQPDIDGGLIGGAALKASDFLAIAQSV